MSRGAETLDGGRHVKKSVVTLLMIVAAGLLSPMYAQGQTSGIESVVAQWSIIAGGFALSFAAAFGALGQGKAVSSAVEGIARNPSAAGDIRGALILGLVLIESLVIYALLVSLILFFVKPFSA